MVVSFPFMHKSAGNLFFTLSTLLLVALQAQSIAILLALLAIRKSDGRGRVRTTLYILTALGAISQLSPDFKNVMLDLSSNVLGKGEFKIYWYFIPFSIQGFNFFSLILWTAWILFAVYRNFRTEYQYLNGSIAWIGFLIFFIFFQFGSISSVFYDNSLFQMQISKRIFIIGLTNLVAFGFYTYCTLLLEDKNFVSWKKCIVGFQEGNWKKVGNYAPLWLLTFLFFLVLMVIEIGLLFFIDIAETSASISALKDILRENKIFSSMAFIGVLFSFSGFILRDIFIFLFLHAAPRHRRADGAGIIYLLVLYFLIPILLWVVGAWDAAFLFLPISALSWIGAFGQAAVIFYFFRAKIVKRELIAE
jgi:hypothetical protein